jgi:hypothetical protein
MDNKEPLPLPYRVPELQKIVTTYEFFNDKWVAMVSHTFFADTQQELIQIIEAHRRSDDYFDASFKGEYKGIKLLNGESEVLFP